jgi:iron complex outermembrane receptor protein
MGQDLPFVLNQVPSVVVNSDAGNGIGYTGIRIRGTDATRINVTLNGIPYNDAESQGTFFVDLPDFASSVNSIQVQRGVGTSSNGSGAFGATINISSNEVNKEAYAELNNSFGSFDTWKNTVKAGSGLIGDHFTTDIRFSNVTSDGYIERAKTDLKSLYFSTAYLADKAALRFNFFTGKEKTYQAWNGVSEPMLQTNRRYNSSGTEKSGEPYDNETDNYTQSHYQLFFNQNFSKNLSFNTAVFLTRGKGYYEQYKAEEDYGDYYQPYPVYNNDTVFTTDLVRQLWLDNYYYGNIFSFQYKTNKSSFILGGGWHRYDGNHYGDIVWAQNGLATPKQRWYDLEAKKRDVNIYFKQQTQLSNYWNIFYDIQYRNIKYDLGGFRNNPSVIIANNYSFINPKLGISYFRNGWNGYFSYSRAAKEPNRDDFEAGATQQPKPEKLNDIEAGVGKKTQHAEWSATFYYMHYKDQLVLTGKINDVGAYTRTNIPKSYRAGIELQGNAILSKWLNVTANLALSRNKVIDFTEYIDDFDNGGQKTNSYESADIAFSPNIVGGATINFIPVENFEISLLSKYTGKQYLDNTQNEGRKLDAFYVQDARMIYSLKKAFLKEVNFIFQVNNIFNQKYEPNGYTFSYIYGGELATENYYFPMAGMNFYGRDKYQVIINSRNSLIGSRELVNFLLPIFLSPVV